MTMSEASVMLGMLCVETRKLLDLYKQQDQTILELRAAINAWVVAKSRLGESCYMCDLDEEDRVCTCGEIIANLKEAERCLEKINE